MRTLHLPFDVTGGVEIGAEPSFVSPDANGRKEPIFAVEARRSIRHEGRGADFRCDRETAGRLQRKRTFR